MLHRPWPALQQLIPLLASSTCARSPGLHVSELYNEMHPQKARKSDPISESDLQLYAVGGFSMEMVLEAGFRQLVLDRVEGAGLAAERPDEIVSSEGIICSPDLFFHEPDDIIIGDIKCKWLSTKNMPIHEEGENDFPSSFDKHLTQLQCYLHVLSENLGRSFTRGRLICYFVNGDWKSFKPRLYAWDLEWSVQEIEETWDAIISIARGRR